MDLSRTRVRIASIGDLIRIKRLAAKPQDLIGESGPPPEGSFAAAERFRLLLSLESTPAERLLDLEAMIDFNETVEALNPKVRGIAERLSGKSAE